MQVKDPRDILFIWFVVCLLACLLLLLLLLFCLFVCFVCLFVSLLCVRQQQRLFLRVFLSTESRILLQLCQKRSRSDKRFRCPEIHRCAGETSGLMYVLATRIILCIYLFIGCLTKSEAVISSNHDMFTPSSHHKGMSHRT